MKDNRVEGNEMIKLSRIGVITLNFALALSFLGGCSRRPETSEARPPKPYTAFKEPPISTYEPGIRLDLSEYHLARRLLRYAIEDRRGAETASNRLNRLVEPEATLALLRILTDPRTRVFYGSFTPEEDGLGNSEDGLIGLRVIYQLEWPGKQGNHLLSALAVYDKNLNFMVGPDSVRIRIEVKPSAHPEHSHEIEGFAGFTWLTEKDGAGRLAMRGVSYVNDRGARKYAVNNMATPDNCTSCHHSHFRNNFDEAEIVKPARAMEGYRGLMEHLRDNVRLTPEKLSKVALALDRPAETFRGKAMIEALRRRWQEIESW